MLFCDVFTSGAIRPTAFCVHTVHSFLRDMWHVSFLGPFRLDTHCTSIVWFKSAMSISLKYLMERHQEPRRKHLEKSKRPNSLEILCLAGTWWWLSEKMLTFEPSMSWRSWKTDATVAILKVINNWCSSQLHIAAPGVTSSSLPIELWEVGVAIHFESIFCLWHV